MTHTGTTSAAGALVPAIDTASSTAAIRSLGRRAMRTVAVSEHERPPAVDSKYCDEHVRAPDPAVDLPAYEERLVELAVREDIDTILPFREPDVYVLARNRDTLADHVGTPWPSLSTLRQVQDRVELFAAAERAGVATPTTQTLDEWDDWDRNCIIKPRYTLRAPEYDDSYETPECQWSSTEYVEPGTPPDREATVAAMGHVPLVQAFVPTLDEYGFFAQYDHGRPVATFQHRQHRGWQYAGGPSAFREAVDIPALERAGRALLDELDWHGVAMVEFLRDPRTGEFKLMEINPRFWSSLPFTIQAGVDFPLLYWAQATGRDIESQPSYEVGIAGHLLRGEALHLASILTTSNPLIDRPSLAGRSLDVATSIARHPRFDYLSRDDPGPFLTDLRNTLTRAIGTRPTPSIESPADVLTAVQKFLVGK